MSAPAPHKIGSRNSASEVCRHKVQLYGAGEAPLIEGVCQYFREAVERGEGILAIASPAHLAAILTGLHGLAIDVKALQRQGAAIYADAGERLTWILRDGQPDARKFQEVVGGMTLRILDGGKRPTVRAYGEMVGLLWTAGQRDAAMRLEELWNDLLGPTDYRLICGYPIDVFSGDFATAGSVLASHGRLLPSDSHGVLQAALNRALVETLGNKLNSLRGWMRRPPRPDWAGMPAAEADILWLRTNLPGTAAEILDRARRYYREGLGSSTLPLPPDA